MVVKNLDEFIICWFITISQRDKKGERERKEWRKMRMKTRRKKVWRNGQDFLLIRVVFLSRLGEGGSRRRQVVSEKDNIKGENSSRLFS